MATRWIGSEEVSLYLDEKMLIFAMQSAFLTTSAPKFEDIETAAEMDRAPRRVHVELSNVPGAPTNASAMVLLPGTVADIPAYTVKVHAKYPDNGRYGRPAIQGAILLFEAESGRLLAVLDSPLLTAHRTAAAGAVAAQRLARPDAHKVAVIGAGVQGEMQFRYLRHVRDIHEVRVYDVQREVAGAYRHRRLNEGVSCFVAESVAEAVRDADIVVTATWAQAPILFPDMVQPGVHISTFGPDAPGKVEVSEDLVTSARLVCDDVRLARQVGALNTFEVGGSAWNMSCMTLADVLCGRAQGRLNPSDITVFAAVGLPFQDLVAAWQVYQAVLNCADGVELA